MTEITTSPIPENKLHVIGYYEGVPVFYNADEFFKNKVWRGRKSSADGTEPGIVLLNNETGKITNVDGTPWVPPKSEFMTKCYIVSTDDIVKAHEHINKVKYEFHK